MATTSVYGLRYLESGDSPDIAAGTRELAEDVETELSRIDGTIRRGKIDVALSGSANATATVTFSPAFSALPIITTQVVTGNGAAVSASTRVTALTATGCTVIVDLPSAQTITIPVHWIAVEA